MQPAKNIFILLLKDYSVIFFLYNQFRIDVSSINVLIFLTMCYRLLTPQKFNHPWAYEAETIGYNFPTLLLAYLTYGAGRYIVSDPTTTFATIVMSGTALTIYENQKHIKDYALSKLQNHTIRTLNYLHVPSAQNLGIALVPRLSDSLSLSESVKDSLGVIFLNYLRTLKVAHADKISQIIIGRSAESLPVALIESAQESAQEALRTHVLDTPVKNNMQHNTVVWSVALCFMLLATVMIPLALLGFVTALQLAEIALATAAISLTIALVAYVCTSPLLPPIPATIPTPIPAKAPRTYVQWVMHQANLDEHSPEPAVPARAR